MVFNKVYDLKLSLVGFCQLLDLEWECWQVNGDMLLCCFCGYLFGEVGYQVILIDEGVLEGGEV